MTSFDLSAHRVSRIVADSGVNNSATGSWLDLVIFASDRLGSAMTITLFFEDKEVGAKLEAAIKSVFPE